MPTEVIKIRDSKHGQACIDMLEFHGINPRDIPLDDAITKTGYTKYVRNEDGSRSIRDGFLVLSDEIPWPKSFPVASFFEHYWAWKGAVV